MRNYDTILLERAYTEIANKKIISEYVTPTETGEDVSPEQRAANAEVTRQNLMNQKAQELAAKAKEVQNNGGVDPVKAAYDAFVEANKKLEESSSEENIEALKTAYNTWLQAVTNGIKAAGEAKK